MKNFERFSNYSELLIVGPSPPPLGGVSVFLYRLEKKLNNAKHYDFSGGGIASYILLFLKLIFSKSDAVHLNVINIKVCFIFLFAKLIRNFDLFIVDHNDQLFVGKNLIQKKILTRLFKATRSIQTVGEHIKHNYLLEIGDKFESKIIVENAFIPPPMSDKMKILSSYPDEYFEFIQRHKKIIVTSAFRLIKDDGIDLYGIDMIIEVMNFIATQYSKGTVGLVVFIADATYNSSYFEELKRKTILHGIDDSIIFITGQKELWPAYMHASLSIRATSRDGYGVSISESIYLGCPAIASNVCTRAEGTLLFNSRDQFDLNQCVDTILKD